VSWSFDFITLELRWVVKMGNDGDGDGWTSASLVV
jgi:hypothetical protein